MIKNTYKKTEGAVKLKFQTNKKHRRATGFNLGRHSDRRFTVSTAVSNLKENKELQKDEYMNKIPKIHMAEILSIQASERLSEVLDPIYETIDRGEVVETCNSIGKAHFKSDEYSKTSSIADARDWIKCISEPTSSVYENSLNDYEVNYLERKFSNSAEKDDSLKIDERKYYAQQNKIQSTKDVVDHPDKNIEISEENVTDTVDDIYASVDKKKQTNSTKLPESLDSDSENELINEILQYFDSQNVILDANILTPNRNDSEKNIFIE